MARRSLAQRETALERILNERQSVDPGSPTDVGEQSLGDVDGFEARFFPREEAPDPSGFVSRIYTDEQKEREKAALRSLEEAYKN